MDPQTQWKDTTQELLRQLKKSDVDYKLLDTLIKSLLETDNKSSSLRNIQDLLAQFFQINPNLFIDYMNVPVIFKIDDLSLDSPTYKRVLENLNDIKLKYGIHIRELITNQREPFSITSVETSISHNESTHTIRFIRGDGMTLDGMFKPVSLMGIVASLTSSLRISMEKGIYNLDPQIIDLYLSESKELEKFLKQLLENANNE
ncbi:hypothetical protein M4D56_01825 [Cytobacillus oceanisediminis]|uniref:hypothetical protein n=1 Tax=Cytobacillus oceanisediminis TaxID=665099 RepID=UPI00203E0EE2|nr:hypothetical protein [Cytobacillus oceanisediminis]MCM3527833.1 hypothetical protein [Cytobacillus oceanisediminis]